MPILDHFTLIAPWYDRVIKPPDPDRMRKLAGLPVEGRLLDVGGGTGRISYALSKWVTSVAVVDSSLGMLAQARPKDGLMTVCGYSEHLCLASDAYERVIMVDALHHVIDYRLTLAELWRVVKPGGRIIIEEPDIQTTPAKIMAIFEKLLLMRSHFISPRTIQDSFIYPNARTRIESEGSTCWVIIDKLPDANFSKPAKT